MDIIINLRSSKDYDISKALVQLKYEALQSGDLKFEYELSYKTSSYDTEFIYEINDTEITAFDNSLSILDYIVSSINNFFE